MPRPPDTYTHSQFSLIDADTKGETVQCNHCKDWTGHVKPLNRKKDHLLKCQAYMDWRSQGNGQDLRPPAPYTKRDSNVHDEEHYDSPYGAYGGQATTQHTPQLARDRTNFDITKSFDEFWDDSVSQKCMRVRCRHCGFVRAKNTTRQVEHLAACREFLQSTDGREALANGGLMPTATEGNGDVYRGSTANPNLTGMIARRGPNKSRASTGNQHTATRQAAAKPSLANHLVTRLSTALADATQKPFLSHAGIGTLSAPALNQWLAQEIHISRALVPFVGSLIGKTRIPETSNLTQDPTYRALDLLCSAVNNMKKELEFLESTKRKYDLTVEHEEPQAATQSFMDLLTSASCPQSSLLEGLVVLWASEHCFCASFQYASSLMSTMPSSSSAYQLPSYLTPGRPTSNRYGRHSESDNQHIAALHQAFIQNWTSANFVRFVSACKSIVDEVANAQTTGNGKTEMMACERRFRQAISLWGQIWPGVDGMGEEEDDADDATASGSHGAADGDKAIEMDDDLDADAAADSPYGGTGLEAIAAHNRASVPS
ncbi:hypothetical protein LTR62_005661 [Meristemomyces frigidus]|uniref:Heme oxygenase-like protein n=1 Tax=Meristemomyces frigidus TaxID=1508187 RepID=A0AAN7TCV2_9PEZI|nr:hypothetical protein LTR62_005661 [Meristemomyces frigidus]